jgi:hypothetical protein
MRLPTLAIGDTLEVEFLDHSEGDNEVLFTLYGRLIEKDRTKIVVACWCYADHEEARDDNVTRYTILRSAIKGIWKLKRTK